MQGAPHEAQLTCAMTTKARRAPGRRQRAQSTSFLFGAKEASSRRGVPRNQPKVFILVQQDQDRQDDRTEVIAEPTAASRPEAFEGEDHFSQDRMYFLSPFKSGRCGIPSRQHLGRGPRPL